MDAASPSTSQGQHPAEHSPVHVEHLLELTQTALWQHDLLSGECHFIERSFELLGYPSQTEAAHAYCCSRWEARIHPDDLAARNQTRTSYLASLPREQHGHYMQEMRIRHRDGNWHWIRECGKVAEWTAEGRPRLLVGTHTDISAYKQVEESLRSSQQLLRTVIDEIPDPVILKDKDGAFLLTNRAVATLYNTTPEAMVGKYDRHFGVPPEMDEFFRQNVLGIMARGETEIVLEDSQDSKTGEVRHYRSVKKPLKSPLGDNEILVIAQDITDVVRSQARVAESEHRLQEVMRVTHEGIWDWHIPSGRVIHNHQWYELLNAEPGSIAETVEAFASLLHPEDQPEVWQRLEAMLKGETETYLSEHRMVDYRGQTLWVQDRGRVVARDTSGQPVRIIGSFRDITQRREAEQRIATLLEDQQAILQSEVVGFVMLEGRTMSWLNPAYAKMLGYHPEELLHQSTHLLYPDDASYQTFAAEAYPVVQQGEVYRAQRQYRRRDGSLGWFDISGAQLKHGSEASIWAFVDISAQKETEQALIAAQQAAEAANLAKSRFLATMSHEIRTPMNGILGMAQLLLELELSPEEHQDYVETILTSGQTLLGLLNDILDLSKVEAGKLELELRDFSPATLVSDMQKLFSDAVSQKGISLSAQWQGPGEVLYRGDPLRLRQMLSNLVSNAIKFTHQGSVTLLAQKVRRQGAHSLLEFSVRDTGIGIAPDKQRLLFQPFSQADSSTTRHYGGTGLGLSIVRQLAQLMGGEAGVDTTEGVGSRFWFRIPALVQHQP